MALPAMALPRACSNSEQARWLLPFCWGLSLKPGALHVALPSWVNGSDEDRTVPPRIAPCHQGSHRDTAESRPTSVMSLHRDHIVLCPTTAPYGRNCAEALIRRDSHTVLN